MTAISLLNTLRAFAEEATADLWLPANVRPDSGEAKTRRPNVFLMWIPDKDSMVKASPYVLFQFIKSEDGHGEGEVGESRCLIRIVCSVFNEDGQAGGVDLMNLMTRLRIALLKTGRLGRQFVLCPPLEMIVYTNETAPLYLGEMMTVWDMPPIESEVTWN